MLTERFREATTLHQAGALEQAEAIYREMLCEDPEHAGAWHRQGLIFLARGDLPQALEHVEHALTLCDTKAVYWNNYGAVLKELKRQEHAKNAFQKALALRDDYVDAWSNLGSMQAELGQLDEAEKSIRYALQLHPQHADAMGHLAAISYERGELEEAFRLCQDALVVAPAKGESHDLSGRILGAMKRPEEAAAAYERARLCNPTAVDIQLNLGHAYTDLEDTEKARQAFQGAARMRPDLPMWQLRHLGLCPTVFQNAVAVDEYRVGLERQLDEALADPPLFDWRTVLRDGVVPSFQLSHHGVCNRRIKERFAQLFAPRFPQERPRPKRRNKIRVAFTCTRGHEGGFLRGFGGVMERLDRKRFEVFGLVSQGIVQHCRTRVRSDDVTWIGFPQHMETVLRVFREAECDVVMHWQAGTDIMNYFLPFLPLAPVQCIGFGNHGTTGISNIDYFVSSGLFERGSEADEDYAESLVQFKGTTAWQQRPATPQPARREDFGLPDEGTLYFCPQRHAKFHPEFDGVLRNILAADRSGHVIILQGNRPRSAESLRRRLADCLGEDFSRRVLFVPSQKASGYYRLLSLMDVVLDTPVYSASLTGYDAFSLGIPVVSMPGRHMVQRYAAGFYERMGIQGLTVDGPDEYVRLAVELGRDVSFRDRMRERIQEQSGILFEDASAVREYDEFFSEVVHKR